MSRGCAQCLTHGEIAVLAAAVLLSATPNLRAAERSLGLMLSLFEGESQSRLLGLGRSWCGDWKDAGSLRHDCSLSMSIPPLPELSFVFTEAGS